MPLPRALRAYTAAAGLFFTGLTAHDIGQLYLRGTPPTRPVTHGIIQENAISAALWPVVLAAVVINRLTRVKK